MANVAIGVAYADQDIINSANVLANASTGQLGYNTGGAGVAPASVTQGTSKSTGVTINAAAGQIVTNAASLAATTAVSFTVTNSQVAATDVVLATIASGATAGAYSVFVDAVAAGSFRVSLYNRTGGALAEALTLNFALVQISQQ